MTLGRTSSGAIKIKTDGGLRAVNCACCGGGLDCGCVGIAGIMVGSQLLSYVLDNATTGAVNGYGPINWEGYEDGWAGEWGDGFTLRAAYSISGKILCMTTDNLLNYIYLGGQQNSCLPCITGEINGRPASCSLITQSVNGHIFDAVYAETDTQYPLSPPVVVFS
jgi:hypothetical protein